MNVKTLWRYHLITLTPIVILSVLYGYHILSNLAFGILMTIYAFSFRTWVDFKRLKELGYITGRESYWTKFRLRFEHFRMLMLGTKTHNNK